ncbi:MAG: recombinase family protein [Chitinophagaceae bacterium]|nr:recombinase family protein [Chitinophagaceae bacterium]
MESKKVIGIWIRVSTEMQVKDDSPEHHEKRARLYAEAKGWEVAEVYRLEAVSGKSVMDLPETKRMLNDVKAGKITGLIFSKLARLARNTKELLEFADIFKSHNADLISLAESIDTSTPAGRLFYTMIAAMATWEREEIADRVAASVPIRAKLGKPLNGQSSFGYKWQGKELVIDEKEAPVRKLLYEIFLKTKRKKATARELNEMGYRTRNGSKFGHTTVARLLQDTTAKGIRRTNYTTAKKGNRIKSDSEWVYVPCPALIPETTWEECNRILSEQMAKMKKPGPKAVHLLSGYMTCSCGKKMYVYHKDKTPTYRCKECNTKVEVADIDEIYLEQLKSFLFTDSNISDYLKRSDIDVQEKQQLLDNSRSELAKLQVEAKALVGLRLTGELNKETLAPLIKPVEERIAQLENTLPELEAELDFLRIQYLSSETVLAGAKDLYNNWIKLPFEEKRSIVEMITNKITVGKSDIHIDLSYLPTPAPPSFPLNSGKRYHNQRNMAQVLSSASASPRISFPSSIMASRK